MGKIFLDVENANEHLVFAFNNLYHLGFGLKATARSADVNHHLVAVEGVHRVALGNHDGGAVVALENDAVLAIAAAHKHSRGNIVALGCLELAWRYLGDESVNRQLLKNLDNEGALLGGLGSHLGAHLLVVEGCLILSVEEVDYLVVKLSTLYLIGV